MAGHVHLWSLNQNLEIQTNLTESITKISNIDNHLYLQTLNNRLYHGEIQDKENKSHYLELELKEEWKVIDLDCCTGNLYIIDTDGRVFKCSKNLEVLSEVCLIEDLTCSRGHSGTKCKMKVEKLAVGDFGQLFVTANGQLWASGHMPQIGINSDIPRKVNFFSGRLVHNVNVGSDFAISIVSKQVKEDDNLDSDDEDNIFVPNCPQCLSVSQLTSPASQMSVSDLCPLGVKVQGSYDIETTSTSSKNDSSISLNDKKNCPEESDGSMKNEGGERSKAEKNIIFRNTEAAKEFLTRQISRMSSAGEEYLVECTEKPTRIIKENMTNVASFVYEGVKTVGDKVVTLSRHVSGSSDCNSVIENNEEMNNSIPRSASKDDCLLSLSQCTSEKDLLEHEIRERAELVLKRGAALINCEVWTWGNIIHGQLDRPWSEDDNLNHSSLVPSDYLNGNVVRRFFSKIIGTRHEYELPDNGTGIGDIIKRERPMIITKLSNIGVWKASVQNYHASVLTLDGRAFIWGRNNYNQVTTETNNDQSSPKLYICAKDERIKDIVCGEYFTVLLTSAGNTVYFGQESQISSDLVTYSSNDAQQNTLDRKNNRKVALFRNLLCSNQYTLLNVNCFADQDDVMSSFMLQEQKFLEEMLVVHTGIVKSLQKRNVNSANVSLFDSLCKKYVDLLHFSATSVHSLLEYSNGLISKCDIIMFKCLDEFIYVFKNYADVVLNVVCIDGFQSISKLIEIPQSLYKLRSDCFTRKDKNNSDELLISTLLKAPLLKLEDFSAIFHDCANNHSSVDQRFVDISCKWADFVEEQETKRKQAELTIEFWQTSGKVIDHLKTPDRRLIRDSHKHPIQYQNAGRFSSHWFVLFSDTFCHVNGSTPHLHKLTTIWLEPYQDEATQQYQISLKMPEETLVLTTGEAEAKIEWFHSLQNAVKMALNKRDALQPPAVRSGTYTFLKSGFLKDATYTGRWLNGKMHGHGSLEWVDGKMYTGQFSSNQLSGYGIMNIPNVGTYEGQWKDNQQNGFGIFTYANTADVYKGQFKDGQPHGHGFLRKGNFMAQAASFYIGDWLCGLKNGYGVMDDILTGEKYIGNWLDGKKHGSGLIVTSDGVYYEGCFNQDALTGQGVMILEDGTHYEGEFRGVGMINGKGTLTLPSGHVIEGNLNGSWTEGIKISSGTFTRKSENKTPLLPKSFKELCTPCHQKWKALFRQCHQVLGVPENSSSGGSSSSTKNGSKPLDTQKIWQNVAVHLSNASTVKISKSDKKFQNALNHLDIIPPYGREKLNLQAYLEVKSYLSKAFESSYHPLGSLLTDLSEAYTTTYGGRAHPLLLGHAIAELHYICKRLYEIVRFLFPALPIYDKECLIENSESDEIINYQSLLYPLILPKVHHPLFTLFTLKNEQQEKQYKRTLMEWNKQSDYTLMAFLSVDQKFFKTQEPTYPPPSSVLKLHAFEEAIETLQQLKSTFSPTEKLLVIRQTVDRMTRIVQEMLGTNYVWNMDDLFPLFLFVVVRARIPELGSELDFVDNFMDPSLESGELGIMYTTLKRYHHTVILDGCIRFKDEVEGKICCVITVLYRLAYLRSPGQLPADSAREIFHFLVQLYQNVMDKPSPSLYVPYST